MKKTCMSARMVSLMLVLALLAGFALPVRAGRAEQGSQAKALSFEQTASSAAPSAFCRKQRSRNPRLRIMPTQTWSGYPSYWTGLPPSGPATPPPASRPTPAPCPTGIR
ncbi:MAG: hypothetical protein ACLSHU_09520 [Oscillospiraceae bacterium]